MAGRPAGGGGLLYGLVAFAILSVVFLGLFIWQFISNEDLRQRADAAARRSDQIGTPPDYYVTEASTRRTSAMNVLTEDLDQMSQVIVGVDGALPMQIKEAAERVVARVAAETGAVNSGDTLLTAVQRLAGEVAALRADGQSRAERITSLEQELTAKNEQLRSARDEFAAQVSDLQGQLGQIQDETDEQLQRKDEQLAALEARFSASSEELNRSRIDQQQSQRLHEVELARLERQVDDYREQIEELNPRGFSAEDILTKADGQILRAIPGSDVVFVNLGSAVGAKPGLTFEVFATGGDRGAAGRGKASIELLTVGDAVSEARVTRQTDALIEGDVIVNVAFERNRKPKFVIRGDFDLNHDGQVDWDGRDRIEAIVRRWGGEVVEDLAESTDFLIVGLGPEPVARGQRGENAISRDVIEARLEELDAFRDVIESAQRLYIPILTQSQFLHLTGYTDFEITTASR